MSANIQRTDLFKRHPSNPILVPGQWPYRIHTTFNAGATLLTDGTTLLLCRVEDRRGQSHLSAARSINGVNGWEIDPLPTLAPDIANYPEDEWGLEDPRITYLQDISKYAVTYTSYSIAGPLVSLALTEDFRTFERQGVVLPPLNKDAAVFPRKINGQYLILHRPMAGDWGSHIWIASSNDLIRWGQHRLVMTARRGGWWDAVKIGLSTPPIETDRGWLLLYHGVRQSASGYIYRMGAALLDIDDPGICLRRGDEWIFAPVEPYEMLGDVDDVVFPCGQTIAADGDTIYLYYGGADTCMALAIGSVKEILIWLEEYGKLAV